MTRYTPSSQIHLLLTTSLLLLLQSSHPLPLTFIIPNSGSECLYEKLSAGEHITMSIFVTTGAELRGTATLEGPIAPESVTETSELNASLKKYEKGDRFGTASMGKRDTKPYMDRKGNLKFREVVDFEHLVEGFMDDDDDDDADDREVMDRNRRRRESRKDRRPRIEGGPWETTFQIVTPGWYKGCVLGSWYQITAEFELRKSSELELNPNTQHVNTHEERQLLTSEKQMDADAAKESDLQTTKTQIKNLNRLLNRIRAKQVEERHRLEVHAATNEHSHSRMVLSSLLETVLFIVVTGFQVYTIRKWFQGDPILGM